MKGRLSAGSYFSELPKALRVCNGCLAFAAGALTTLAFAPFSLQPLAVLTLALLFFLWNGSSARQAFRLGWLFGVGFLGFGVFWLHISIDQFGNVGWWLAVLITLLFVLAMALYFGLTGWVARRLAFGSGAVSLLLLYPALWVLAEWLRGWVLTGFPWLALGYSQVDLPIRGLAPLLGVYGVSWGVAVSAGLLLLLVAERRTRTRILILAGAMLLWGVAALAASIAWTQPQGARLQVSLVQGNVAQHLKWRREEFLPTLSLYRGHTRANWESDLVIWPETAVPAYRSRVEKDFLAPLAEEARAHDSAVLLGIVVRNPDEGRYYNAMLSLGDEEGLYLKRHLVPFGEFLPLKAWLGPLLDWMTIPMSDFSPGEAPKPLVTAAGYPVGVSICYEDAFGEEVIQALPEAAFLVNASNDAWFGDSLAPHQHLEIARMRALESGRFMLRSTNTGISAIIDHKGRILAKSPAFEEHVLSGEILPMKGGTPYALWGNYAIVILCVSSLLVAGWRGRRWASE